MAVYTVVGEDEARALVARLGLGTLTALQGITAGIENSNYFLDASAGRSGYLPFGQGPRLCIGRDFALGEMVVVLARLLQTHRVSTPPGWVRPTPQAQVAVHPQGGMPLVLAPVVAGGVG